MAKPDHFFFCGIGGSGMLPLALIVHHLGHGVSGSDRSRDQGHSPEKFAFLEGRGMLLSPQDGSGLSTEVTDLVASAAIEDTVPDIAAGLKVGARRQTRAELLSRLFNAADIRIGIAGTSGKSTVTGMVAWILHQAGRGPTVMNGAVMNNFVSLDMPFASAVLGDGSLFVSEVDESDGSIALYDPTIAVLNNVSEDHKSMAELRQLFGDYLGRARHAVINVDDPETRVLGGRQVRKQTYSVTGRDADLVAKAIKPEPTAIGFEVWERGRDAPVVMTLPVPGHHNVSNALAALSVARLLDVPLEAACEALSGFGGIRRRFDVVGTKNDVTVIDDFGHNPDKIAATLRTLHAFSGRLLVMFQPHGFGPLRLMRREFVEMFRAELAPDDVLVMPEPVYFGGTVNRTVTTGDLVDDLKDAGVAHAEGFATRDECGHRLRELARPGDRIIIMGARDDTLAVFARDLLKSLPT